MSIIGTDIDIAIELLENGKLVGIPTETVYGLAANALDEIAVAKIFSAKKRPTFNPLIVHIASSKELEKFTISIPKSAQKLADAFMPGSITLLLPKNHLIPNIVTADSHLAGFRVPNHALTLELLSKLDFPLAAPSANPFGYISPVNAYHVEEQLGKEVDYILDGGECEIGIESTVVGFDNETPVIHRHGAISAEMIKEVCGEYKIADSQSSPGMLKLHYSPRTMTFYGNIDKLLENKDILDLNVGAICFTTINNKLNPKKCYILSELADLNEAAKNLFKYMHEADERGFDILLLEKLPNKGIGIAINDRLFKAAGSSIII